MIYFSPPKILEPQVELSVAPKKAATLDLAVLAAVVSDLFLLYFF